MNKITAILKIFLPTVLILLFSSLLYYQTFHCFDRHTIVVSEYQDIPAEVNNTFNKDLSYTDWMWGVITKLDLGISTVKYIPVSEIIFENIRPSIILSLSAAIFTFAFSWIFILIEKKIKEIVMQSEYAALLQNKIFGYLYKLLMIVALSIPIWVWAVMFQDIYIMYFRLDPSERDPRLMKILLSYLIPIIVMCLGDGGLYEMIANVRNELHKFNKAGFMTAVHARKARPLKHVFKNTFPIFLSSVFSRLQYMFGLTILVEYVFLNRGLGYILLSVLKTNQKLDYPLLLGICLVFTFIILLLRLFEKLILTLFVPAYLRS